MVDLSWQVYRFPLHQPLHTAHGLWTVREGIRLWLRNEEGCVGYGEIAPIPWFGSETLASAIAFCEQLPAQLDYATIRAVPPQLPATQFGFEAAWLDLQQPLRPAADLCYSQLLPTGEAALQGPKTNRVYKWKIGVYPWPDEQAWLRELLGQLPGGARLRLDANGSLDRATTEQLINLCPCDRVELIEQPLADPIAMWDLAAQSPIPIALDESVSSLAGLQQWQEWPGIFVIKPAIAGFPSDLVPLCQGRDIVISSAIETLEGRRIVLGLTQSLSQRALGFSTTSWFAE